MTLIELMIVVVIVGILTAIAVPAYKAQITESRRMDMINLLMQMQMQQESWRMQNPEYATLAQLGSPTHEFYTIGVFNTSASTYTLTATAKGGQVSDSGCTVLSLNQSSIKTPSACWKK